MGLAALVIYGVGDMLGAGIYGLVGKAAKQLGNMVWLAFVVSMIAAIFTGLSYASLGSRYPKAAGAAKVSSSTVSVIKVLIKCRRGLKQTASAP